MARGIEGNEIAEQKAKKTPGLSTQKSDPKQRNIASFFQKKAVPAPAPTAVTPLKRASDANDAEVTSKPTRSDANITPAPASSSPLTLLRGSQQSSVQDGLDKENGTAMIRETRLIAALKS